MSKHAKACQSMSKYVKVCQNFKLNREIQVSDPPTDRQTDRRNTNAGVELRLRS